MIKKDIGFKYIRKISNIRYKIENNIMSRSKTQSKTSAKFKGNKKYLTSKLKKI